MPAAAPEAAAPIPAPPRQYMKIWPIYRVLLAIHLLCFLAFIPYCFTWWGLASLLVGNFIFGSIGINLGYHRLLTHGSLKCPKWLERAFVICGVCSLEGTPLRWVAIHRKHHQHGDADQDPHSPVGNFYWGHMGWVYTAHPGILSLDLYEKYVPDLMGDKFLRWLQKKNRALKIYYAHAAVIVLGAFAIALAVTQELETAVQVAVQAFVWGVVVRTVYVWHITWLVNSAAHRFGYRNYSTSDVSTNCWWVAALTNGEGWHNNHHAAPRAASHGHKWWELDLTYKFIRGLELVGLAKQVVPVKVASYKTLEAA